MADTATTALRFRDQESGGNDGTWGTLTDVNFALVEEAISGVLTKDISGSGTTTLTTTNFVSDEARHMTLKLTGTLTGISYVVLPNVEKLYFIHNATGGEFAVYVKTSSGDSVEIPVGKDIIYVDGSNVITTLLGASLANIVSAVNTGTLATLAANIAAINGVYANATNITTVSGINGNVTSVANNSSNISAVANNKTNIDALNTDPLKSNINTVAGLSSEVGVLNGISSAISTVSGIQANVSTVAGISSAVSTTATNASAVTAFSLVYHGAASSDPSSRSDSSDLVQGDLYFNSSSNVLKIYSGSAWQAAALDSSGFATSDLQLSNSTQHNILVADGTNFESVSVGSLSAISTVASDDLFLAIDTSGGGLKKITRSTLVAGLATSSAITEISQDDSPQLGGNLDTNSHNILIDDAHFIGDENGNEQIIFQTTSSAVNQFDITNAATGNSPEISATGGDTNIGLKLTPKGSGQVVLDGNVGIESGLIDLKNGGSVSAVRFYCESSNAHYAAVVAPAHSDFSGNVTLTLPVTSSTLVGDSATQTLSNKTLTAPKFADAGFIADANGNEMVVFQTTSSAVNALEVTNSDTGNSVVLGAFGSDSNVDIDLTPKGTGEVNISSKAVANNDVTIIDDKKLYFGTNQDVSLEYDEDGTDSLVIAGGDVTLADDKKFYFGSGQDVSLEYDEDGTDSLLIAGGDVTIADDKKLYFGTNQDVYLEYDEDGTDKLIIKGNTTFLDGSYDFDIASHDGTNGLKLGGTIVSATAAQLNYNVVSSLGTTEASKVVTADANGVVTFDNGKIEESTAVSSSSNAATINLRDGDNFTHTLSENVTYTFSNPAANGKVSAFTLKVTQDSSARTITWPNSVDWGAGTAPTLSTGNAAVDVFVFVTYDGGTIYYGFTAGQAMA